MDGEYYSTTSGGYTWGLVGFFGRVNYAYAGRYLAEVSARYDGRRNSRPVRSGASSPRHRLDGASPKSRGSNRTSKGGWTTSRFAQHRFARQCQHRPLPVPRDHDRFGQRLDRQVVGHHQRPERTLHVGAQPDPRRHHLGKGHHLQHRPRPRPVPQPAFVQRATTTAAIRPTSTPSARTSRRYSEAPRPTATTPASRPRDGS